jgi:hypothetical protein
VPVVAERVWPSCGVPVTVGGAVFAGGDGGADPPTGSVSGDARLVDPTPFFTATTTRSVEPVSADCTVYFAEVPTVVHDAPKMSQRCHSTEARLSGADPIQAPWPRTRT